MLMRTLWVLLATAPLAGFSSETIMEQTLPGAEQSLKASQINLDARKEAATYAQQKEMGNDPVQEIAAEQTTEAANEESPSQPRAILQAQRYDHPSMNSP